MHTFLGTVDYQAPEQARYPNRVTPAADVYSLGCTAVFLLTGRTPFPEGSPLERIAAHRDATPPDLRHLRSDTPALLAELVQQMMAKDPADRPAGMAAVVSVLDGLNPSPDTTRPKVGLLLGVAALILAVGIGAVVWWNPFSLRTSPTSDQVTATPTIQKSPLPDPAGYHRAWANHLGVPVEFTDERGMRLVFVPPGEFVMGSPEDMIRQYSDPRVEPSENHRRWVTMERERPVTITRPFYLGRSEVTKAEFAAFVTDTGYRTQAERFGGGWGYDDTARTWKQGPNFNWRSGGDYQPSPDHPVGNISWEDAVKFCQWLTAAAPPGVKYRLPSESEWEYACRGGGTDVWGHGDDESELGKYAVVGQYKFPQPVVTRRPNGFGLFDLHGNLPEWCDAADPWVTGGVTPPHLWPVRGGSFLSPASHTRSAARRFLDPHSTEPGFRILRELPTR